MTQFCFPIHKTKNVTLTPEGKNAVKNVKEVERNPKTSGSTFAEETSDFRVLYPVTSLD